MSPATTAASRAQRASRPRSREPRRPRPGHRPRLAAPRGGRSRLALAPHAARRLLPASGPRRAPTRRRRSTPTSQRVAAASLRRHLLAIRDRSARDAAVLVADNASGDVLAYVAGSGELSSARHVDGIQARRQAGSTLKPFLYARALDRRLLTAASLLDDTPLEIAVGRGLFRPRNYDEHFRGLGVVAHGAGRLAQRARPCARSCSSARTTSPTSCAGSASPASLQPGDYYGPSLALGSADVTLWELVNAYRALANGGVWSPSLLRVHGRRRAVGAGAAWDASRARADGAAPAARACRRLHRLRHSRRPRQPQRHVRPGEPAGDALLERGEDRHQQGHARQLVHRLLAPLHRRRLGGQLLRRADARRQRRHRRGADLVGRDELAAPRPAERRARRAARRAAGRRRAAAARRPVVRRRHRAADGAAAVRAQSPRIVAPTDGSVIAIDPTSRPRGNASPSKRRAAPARAGCSTGPSSARQRGWCCGRRSAAPHAAVDRRGRAPLRA